MLACGIILTECISADESADSNSKQDPEQTLVYQGDVVISQNMIDAAFSRIPEKDRLPFIRDGKRVDSLVQNLLQTGSLAREASKAGFDKDPIVSERMRIGAEQELANAWLDKIVADAPEPDYEALAWEDYVAHPERYQRGSYVNVTHLLISTDDRTVEEAEALAGELMEQVKTDQSGFDQLILEHSDDPAAKGNGGKYTNVTKGKMVKPFEEAAFALEQPGDFSDVVRTDYGFHIIRLDKRVESATMPYESVKPKALEAVRLKYLEQYRLNYLKSLSLEPVHLVPGAVEIMAKRHFGENLENAPFKAE
jgi:peptidyl-prolyl cis-trans isomerase C